MQMKANKARHKVRFIEEKNFLFRAWHSEWLFLRFKRVLVLPSLILCLIASVSHFASNNASLYYTLM